MVAAVDAAGATAIAAAASAAAAVSTAAVAKLVYGYITALQRLSHYCCHCHCFCSRCSSSNSIWDGVSKGVIRLLQAAYPAGGHP
jgi:hypothetical protein